MQGAVIQLIVCNHFANETRLAAEIAGIDAKIHCFPSSCGHPPTDWVHVLAECKGSQEPCLVLGGCCTRQLDPTHYPDLKLHIHHVEQCFYLFMQPALVDHYFHKGYHQLTPGWLTGWKQHIEQTMGFDRKTARQCYQETVKKLLLIDTGTENGRLAELERLSDYLAIPYEVVSVGLSYYAGLLQRLATEIERSDEQEQLRLALQQQSEYAMVTDLLGGLIDQKNEYDIIQSLTTTFQMLLAPRICCFIPLHDGMLGQPICMKHSEPSTISPALFQADAAYGLVDEDSFWLKVHSKRENFGYLLVEHIAFAQYRQRYLNIALHIQHVAALALHHARDFQKIADLSHQSGKAEVAREIIHNAGNVINSINISVQQLRQMYHNNVAQSLPAIVALMQQQGEALGAFISSDPKGKKIPEYFNRLTKEMGAEHQQQRTQLDQISSLLEHVKAIIQQQNRTADVQEAHEPVNPASLIKHVLQLFDDPLKKANIYLQQELATLPLFPLQKHKILQVLTNLIMNATEALAGVDRQPRTIAIRLGMDDERCLFYEVADNGPGIPDELKKSIFLHGYSCKEGHSGFGLHSAANLASELQGKLELSADSQLGGACFRLRIPVASSNSEESNNE